MAVTADAVFLSQKILRRLGRRMGSVKRRYPQLTILITAAMTQNMLYFLIRKNEHGGFFTLRARCNHVFDLFLLFNFGWEQGGLFYRFGYA